MIDKLIHDLRKINKIRLEVTGDKTVYSDVERILVDVESMEEANPKLLLDILSRAKVSYQHLCSIFVMIGNKKQHELQVKRINYIEGLEEEIKLTTESNVKER